MKGKTMAYVAADPQQPGAAWAACIDKPEHAKEIAKDVASWLRKGATVMRVDIDTASDMLSKWMPPPSKKKADPNQPTRKGESAR